MRVKVILSVLICIVAFLLIWTTVANITGSTNMSFKYMLLQSIWDLLKTFW